MALRERERERSTEKEGSKIRCRLARVQPAVVIAGPSSCVAVDLEAAIAIVILTATCHHRWSQPPSSPFMLSPLLATVEPSSDCAPPRRAVPSWRRGWWLPSTFGVSTPSELSHHSALRKLPPELQLLHRCLCCRKPPLL
ncbi:hypothetical protein AHAS_Ahas19G0136600 [Arachis hypogaea]